jgi:Family of unknown function (DUF5694)
MLVLGAAAPCYPQSACTGKPQILVLGTYHMANPGHDIYNMQVDDVRAPKRQQELQEVADVLAKFQPTKIAVEADPGNKKMAQAYEDYLAGKHELSRNEIEQIGFRLAKRLGHKELYPVDVEGEFPMQRVMNYAKAKDRATELNDHLKSAEQEVANEDAYIKTHTVLESLLYVNSPQSVAATNSFYMQLLTFGEDGDYAGPDLLAAWYTRNIRIQSNIAKLITSPGERILVIYGAGHLPLLQENVRMDSHLCLRTLAEFTAGK